MTPLQKAIDYQRRGVVHISPAEAAEVLACSGEGLRAAARTGVLALPHFYTGRNLRIMVGGLVELLRHGGPMDEYGVRWVR